MATQVKLNVREIKKLASWVQANDLKDRQQVTISVEQTVIGPGIKAHYEVTEDEGRYIDLTDYDSW